MSRLLNKLDDAPEKPLLMPFYFLPYFEKPDYTQQWSYSASENKINISLVVKGVRMRLYRAKKSSYGLL